MFRNEGHVRVVATFADVALANSIVLEVFVEVALGCGHEARDVRGRGDAAERLILIMEE